MGYHYVAGDREQMKTNRWFVYSNVRLHINIYKYYRVKMKNAKNAFSARF
jgi:hypothetical protein